MVPGHIVNWAYVIALSYKIVARGVFGQCIANIPWLLIPDHFNIFQVFFPSFLQSEVYFKYLTELLNSVSEQHSSQALSASDGSADDVRSLGSQISEKSHLVGSTFGSDPDLTENPDAIWQRPNAG